MKLFSCKVAYLIGFGPMKTKYASFTHLKSTFRSKTIKILKIKMATITGRDAKVEMDKWEGGGVERWYDP